MHTQTIKRCTTIVDPMVMIPIQEGPMQSNQWVVSNQQEFPMGGSMLLHWNLPLETLVMQCTKLQANETKPMGERVNE